MTKGEYEVDYKALCFLTGLWMQMIINQGIKGNLIRTSLMMITLPLIMVLNGVVSAIAYTIFTPITLIKLLMIGSK